MAVVGPENNIFTFCTYLSWSISHAGAHLSSQKLVEMLAEFSPDSTGTTGSRTRICLVGKQLKLLRFVLCVFAVSCNQGVSSGVFWEQKQRIYFLIRKCKVHSGSKQVELKI